AGQSATDILQAYYQSTQITPRALGNIRVHLADDDTTTYTLTGTVTWSVNGTPVTQNVAGDTVATRAVANSIRIQKTAPTAGGEVVLGGAGDVVSIGLTIGQPVRVDATGNRYQYGRLVARIKSTGVLQITLDSMTMAQYLYGISEVPS